MDGVVSFVKAFKHGRNGYRRHGCRCDVCRKGQSEYKERCRSAVVFKHGIVGYMVHKCHCDVCRGAWQRYTKSYRDTHPDKMKEHWSRYRCSHPEKIAEKNKRQAEKNRERRAFCPEECREEARVWRMSNIEERRRVEREYMRRRRQDDLDFRLRSNLRTRVVNSLNRESKSAGTMELIGCTIPELRLHLEKRFKPGMSWDNYGAWHVDHIRPCASFDLRDSGQQRVCFNWMNLQPLWAKENHTKSDKMEA